MSTHSLALTHLLTFFMALHNNWTAAIHNRNDLAWQFFSSYFFLSSYAMLLLTHRETHSVFCWRCCGCRCCCYGWFSIFVWATVFIDTEKNLHTFRLVCLFSFHRILSLSLFCAFVYWSIQIHIFFMFIMLSLLFLRAFNGRFFFAFFMVHIQIYCVMWRSTVKWYKKHAHTQEKNNRIPNNSNKEIVQKYRRYYRFVHSLAITWWHTLFFQPISFFFFLLLLRKSMRCGAIEFTWLVDSLVLILVSYFFHSFSSSLFLSTRTITRADWYVFFWMKLACHRILSSLSFSVTFNTK